jgi:hypothetical protein
MSDRVTKQSAGVAPNGSYTAFGTAIAAAFAKQCGLDGSRTLSASLEFVEPGLTVLAVRLVIDDETARAAIAAMAPNLQEPPQ